MPYVCICVYLVRFYLAGQVEEVAVRVEERLWLCVCRDGWMGGWMVD